MKKKYDYKTLLKKHGPEKVLEMYLRSEINLTNKEWNDVHKKIGKKAIGVNTKPIIREKAILLGFVFVVAASILSTGGYMDQITKCNDIKGHLCTKYEIEKMGD